MSGMNLRTVALVGTLSLAAGWMAGSQTAQPSVPSGAGVSSGPRPLGVESSPVAPLTRDLRLRLDQLPNPPQPGRNPFRFRPAAPFSGRAHAADSGPAGDADAVETAPEAEAVSFSLTLAGIATEQADEGPRHTAMVSDGTSLLFILPGDTVPGGYVAVAVGETSLTLRDAAGGERILRLP